jgi:outer membrane lipoprotein-sorting protein
MGLSYTSRQLLPSCVTASSQRWSGSIVSVNTRTFPLSPRSLRWALPVVAGVAVAAAAFIPSAVASAQHPALPARSAGQLLADLASAHPPVLSGTVVETARLGLPDLSSLPGADTALSWQSLITGSHTIHVWMAGPSRQRFALLGNLAETDVIHNGTDLWTYSSETDSVTHMKVPNNSSEKDATPASALPVSPQQAAQAVLAAIDPTTKVAVDLTASVAGRSAYQLVLQPKDPRSLISSVKIALDSVTKVPLRVQVFAKSQSLPAFETTFTEVAFSQPQASVFNFVPPAGAKVSEGSLPRLANRHAGAKPKIMHSLEPAGANASNVIGTGWTAVAVVDAGSASSLLGGSGAAGQFGSLMQNLATAVPGGHVLSTALFTVLFTNDGRILIGAVNSAAIQQVAATGHAL